MNHRQLNLQNIIKQQQAKISQLKQQLGIITQLSQSRIIDTQRRNHEIIIQKDQIISYLKTQLQTLRSKHLQQQKIIKQNSQVKSQKNNFQQEYIKIKTMNQKLQHRNHQLQIKLQKNTQDYQKKLTISQRQIKRLNSELQSLNQNFTLTQTQIEKITKYYKAAMFQIPKRKQTLLWVDNLIKYMQVSETTSQKKYRQIFDYIKQNIQQLQKELMKSISQVALIEQGLVKDYDKISLDMRKLVQQIKSNQTQISYGIQESIKTNKKQKQSTQRIQIQSLRSNLQLVQKQYKQNELKLQSRIKQLQTQKKTLVLGFQQIKTFLQNKQTNYKQEIHSLKNTINQLLQANQLRQRQFQQEIKLLSSQIQNISHRYYQNIQYPVIKINQKVQSQLNQLKAQLQIISKQNSFRKEILQLSQKINLYGQSLNEEESQFKAIQLCMKKGNQLLITIRQLVNQMNQKKTQRQRKSINRQRQTSTSQQANNSMIVANTSINMKQSNKRSSIPHKSVINQQSFANQRQQQLSFNNQSNIIQTLNQNQYQQQEIEELKQLQSVVSQIQLKQKQNKYIYEIRLLKKHNQKLTDHIGLLEKKFKNINSNKYIDEKVMNNYFITERKVIQLQSQLQQYKEINQQLQSIIKQQIQKIIKRFQQYRKQIKISNKEQNQINKSLNQLNKKYQIIQQIISNRNNKIQQLKQSTQKINLLLIKPSQTFNNLVKQFTTHLQNITLVYNQSSGRLNQWSSINNLSNSQSYKSRHSINEVLIKQYQQILSRRTQINNNGSRYIIQLIKTLRQTFPPKQNKRKQQLNMNNISDKQNIKNQFAIKGNKISNNDKKIKQIITNQQKYKSQIIGKIDKIVQYIEKIESKKQKQIKLILNKQKKIQLLLEKHFNLIKNQISLNINKSNKQHTQLKTQALKDITSKLKQSIKQNQALKKEYDVLYNISKNFNQKNKNFYQQEDH